jgi:hypothetical protein
LQTYSFCNIFRILDRTTQYLIREVIEVGSQKPNDVVFRVVLFNLFTKIETYELLQRRLGPLTWERYDPEAYEEVLEEAKDDGTTLYTGAFQKPAPKYHHCVIAHKNHLRLLEALLSSGLTKQLQRAESLADVFTFIASFSGMADFTSYQLLVNLSYTSLLNFSEMDFVVGGPGSRSGLTKCFGKSIDPVKMEVGIMRWMAETQNEHFARLGLEFAGLGPEGLPLGLVDIEHTLCEVEKYSRFAHPSVPSHYGRKRTSMKRNFHPSPQPLPSEPTLPAAWSHPDRRIVRVHQGPQKQIQKRYIIHKIIDQRRGDGQGPLEYHIEWFGYPLNQATWEPAESIRADAPDVVRAYNQKKMPRVRKYVKAESECADGAGALGKSAHIKIKIKCEPQDIIDVDAVDDVDNCTGQVGWVGSKKEEE